VSFGGRNGEEEEEEEEEEEDNIPSSGCLGGHLPFAPLKTTILFLDNLNEPAEANLRFHRANTNGSDCVIMSPYGIISRSLSSSHLRCTLPL
jgi:hypothetical protein